MAKKFFHVNDPHDLFIEAQSFEEASRVISNRASKLILKDANNRIGWTMYSTANAAHAFCCELYLKCIMAIEKGEVIEGHNLVALFNDLSQTTKDRIIYYHDKRTIKSAMYYFMRDPNRGSDFMSLIAESQKAFVDFRYLFEKKPKSEYELDFVVWAIKAVLQELRPDFKPQLFED